MSKKKRELWGLDLETSGSSHGTSVPIQIGIYAPNGAVFRSDIGGWRWRAWAEDQFSADPIWSEEAFGIHNITKERLELAADRFSVQRQAARFIEEHTNAWIGNRLVVGWNVASFDMPFVRQYLPAVSNMLSYRSIDLNAATYTACDALGLSYGKVKGASKDYAAVVLEEEFDWPDGEMTWHDAAYDAAAAIHSYKFILQVIQRGGLTEL